MPPDYPEILVIAGFTPMGQTWLRIVGESHVTASVIHDGLEFKLQPSIGTHSADDHLMNAAAGAVLFKTMMTLAERVNGRIVQHSLVGDCQREGNISTRVLAEYPLMPLVFDNLCLGFRRVLGGGIRQEAQ